MGHQTVSFNVENPEADSEKGRPTNSCIFFMNYDRVLITITEEQYRVERDEEAFMKQLQAAGSHAQYEQFLNAKAGGDIGGSGKTLDDIIPKKRIRVDTVEPRVIF